MSCPDEQSSSAQSTKRICDRHTLLDVIQPAMDEGDDYYEHWVLTHFLLDGHHKVEAAARAGRSVRLLCLIDEGISIASADEISTMVDVRGGTRQRRN